MKFITEKKHFDRMSAIINFVVDRDRNFPDIIFREGYQFYCFFDFYAPYMDDFFDKLIVFSRYCGTESFWLSVIDPDPIDYFFRNFLFYPAIEFNKNDRSEDYIAYLNKDPGGSPADAIINNSNIIAIASQDAEWLIWADRDFDIAVCTFRSESKKILFSSIFSEIIFTDEMIASTLPLYHGTH